MSGISGIWSALPDMGIASTAGAAASGASFLWNIRSEMSLSTRDELTHVYNAATALGTNIEEVPIRAIRTLAASVDALLHSEELQTPLTDTQRTRLEELLTLLRAQTQATVNFTGDAEVLNQGLQTIFKVFEGNAPSLLLFTNNLKRALLSASDDAQTSFHTAKTLLRKASTTLKLESGEVRLLKDSLRQIISDSELREAHFPLDFLEGFRDRLTTERPETLEFTEADKDQIHTCLDTVEECIQHKQGVISQLVQTLDGKIFDPRNGLMSQAINQLTEASSAIIDEYTTRAPDSLVTINNSLLRMLSPRPTDQHALSAQTSILKLLQNASSDELLGRELNSSERKALMSGLRHIVHLLLHKGSPEHVRKHINTALSSIEPTNDVIRAALQELQEPTSDFEKNVFAAIKALIDSRDREQRSTIYEALNAMPFENVVLRLTPQYFSKIATAADIVLQGTKAQHGKIFQFVENMKEELAHPTRGMLPQLLDTYLKKVGQSAVKLQGSLRRMLDGKVTKQYQIDILSGQLQDVISNFSEIYHRDPSERESHDLKTIQRYLRNFRQEAEGAPDTTSRLYRHFRNAAIRTINQIDTEQGELQRQLSGVLEQADGLVTGLSEQMDRMIRTIDTSNPIVQIKFTTDILKNAIENNALEDYAKYRRQFRNQVRELAEAETRRIGLPRTSRELRALNTFCERVERLLPDICPTDEREKETALFGMKKVAESVAAAMRAHPEYGEFQALVDRGTSYLEAQMHVMAGNLKRTAANAFGGSIPTIPGSGAAPLTSATARPLERAHVAMDYTQHPTFTFMQTTSRVLESKEYAALEKKSRLLTAIKELEEKDPAFANKIKDALPAGRRPVSSHSAFKKAVLSAINSTVSALPPEERQSYYAKCYLYSKTAPVLDDPADRIRWARTEFEKTDHAYTQALKALAMVQAANTTIETAAPAATPSTPFTGSLPVEGSTMFSGLFGAAWSMIEKAPDMAVKFSLDSLMGFTADKLRNDVKTYISTYDDIDPVERDTVLQSIDDAVSRIERGKEIGSVEGYKEALADAAKMLSKHTFLINGLNIIPNFDEPSISDEFRALEARHIADLERQRRNTRAPGKSVAEVLVENKMRFIDVMSMYTTYQYIFGYRNKPKSTEHAIEADIIKTLLERPQFQSETPPYSREFKKEQALERRRRVGEYTAAEKDTTLERIMRAVDAEPDENKSVVFRDLLCIEIDRRTDLSSVNKWFIKNITVPFLLGSTNLPFINGVIPFFAGQSIDSLVEKATRLIHTATEDNEGKQIDKDLLNGLTKFIAKYDRAIDNWSQNRDERTSSIEGFLFRRSENNGYSREELYNKLATLLVEQFYVPVDLSALPSRGMYWGVKQMTTPPFKSTTVGATVGNICLWPFKAIGGAIATCVSVVPYAISNVISFAVNNLFSFTMKQVLIQGQVMQQITSATEESIYGSDQYRKMLNNVIVDQLKAAWDLQKETALGAKADKDLELIPRLIPNKSIGRKKIFSMLENAWDYLKIAVENVEIDHARVVELFDKIQRELETEDFDEARLNRHLTKLNDAIWEIHSEHRRATTVDKEPQKAAARNAVSQLIQRSIDVLDKDKHLHPHRAREPGLRDRIQVAAREEAMDFVVDSVTDLLLIGIESLMDKDLLESQLSGLLEAATDGMLYKDESMYEYDGPRPDARQAQELVTHYLDLILRQAVDSTVDDISTNMKDSKITSARNILDAMKITLLGQKQSLRTNLRVADMNLIQKWQELLTTFESNPSVELLNQIVAPLSRTLTEFEKLGRGDIRNNTPLGEQLSGELEKSRVHVVKSIHKFHKHLDQLRNFTAVETEASETKAQKETVLQSLGTIGQIFNDKSADDLKNIDDSILTGLPQHINTLTEAAEALKATDRSPHFSTIPDQAERLKLHIEGIKKYKVQNHHLSNISSLLDEYHEKRLQELSHQRGRSTGRIIGHAVAGESNRIYGRMLDELTQLEKFDSISIPRIRKLLELIAKERNPEKLGTIVQELREGNARIQSGYSTRVVQSNAAITTAFSTLRERIRRERAPHTPTSRMPRLTFEQHIERLRSDLENIKRIATELKCPAVINVDAIDLKPGSMKSEWIKDFAHKELHTRAEELVNFVRDETVFKGLWHHMAGMALDKLDDPRAVMLRRERLEEARERRGR